MSLVQMDGYMWIKPPSGKELLAYKAWSTWSTSAQRLVRSAAVIVTAQVGTVLYGKFCFMKHSKSDAVQDDGSCDEQHHGSNTADSLSLASKGMLCCAA